MKQEAAYYDLDFATAGGSYSCGMYAERNLEAAERLKKYQFRHVLEVAGAEGHLAKCILDAKPGIIYRFTDFSPAALELARKQVGHYARCIISPLNADNDKQLDRIPFSDFDCLICTASEHFYNDLEILRRMKSGSVVFLSLPNFPWGGHVRYFKDWDEVMGRFKPYINVTERWEQLATENNRISGHIRRFLRKNRDKGVVKWLFTDIFHADILDIGVKFNLIGYRR